MLLFKSISRNRLLHLRRPLLRGGFSTGLCAPRRLEQVRYHSRPACLMAGTDAAPGITVEVLVEWDVISPVRIVLECCVRAKHWPSPLLVTQKDAGETMRKSIHYLPQCLFRA